MIRTVAGPAAVQGSPFRAGGLNDRCGAPWVHPDEDLANSFRNRRPGLARRCAGAGYRGYAVGVSGETPGKFRSQCRRRSMWLAADAEKGPIGVARKSPQPRRRRVREDERAAPPDQPPGPGKPHVLPHPGRWRTRTGRTLSPQSHGKLAPARDRRVSAQPHQAGKSTMIESSGTSRRVGITTASAISRPAAAVAAAASSRSHRLNAAILALSCRAIG